MSLGLDLNAIPATSNVQNTEWRHILRVLITSVKLRRRFRGSVTFKGRSRCQRQSSCLNSGKTPTSWAWNRLLCVCIMYLYFWLEGNSISSGKSTLFSVFNLACYKFPKENCTIRWTEWTTISKGLHWMLRFSYPVKYFCSMLSTQNGNGVVFLAYRVKTKDIYSSPWTLSGAFNDLVPQHVSRNN